MLTFQFRCRSCLLPLNAVTGALGLRAVQKCLVTDGLLRMVGSRRHDLTLLSSHISGFSDPVSQSSQCVGCHIHVDGFTRASAIGILFFIKGLKKQYLFLMAVSYLCLHISEINSVKT